MKTLRNKVKELQETENTRQMQLRFTSNQTLNEWLIQNNFHRYSREEISNELNRRIQSMDNDELFEHIQMHKKGILCNFPKGLLEIELNNRQTVENSSCPIPKSLSYDAESKSLKFTEELDNASKFDTELALYALCVRVETTHNEHLLCDTYCSSDGVDLWSWYADKSKEMDNAKNEALAKLTDKEKALLGLK